MAGPAAKPRGGEKLRRKGARRGGGGEEEEEGKLLLPERTSKWKCLECFLNYTLKFEKLLKDEAQETGSPFRTASFLISHFLFFWMAHLSQQMLSPDMT